MKGTFLSGLKKTCTALAAVLLAGAMFQGAVFGGDADLRPYQPPGWHSAIAVMDTPENWSYDYDSNPITQMQTVYLNCAWKNHGSGNAPDHRTILYVGSQPAAYSTVTDGSPTGGNWDKFDESRPFVFEMSGTYNLKVDIQVPPGGTVDPQSTFTKQVVVASDGKAHLKPFKPANLTWDDIIVVAGEAGAVTDSPVYAGETSYLNFAWINIGDVPAETGDYTANLEIYLNGALVDRIAAGDSYPTNARCERAIQDYEYQFPEQGDYTLKLQTYGNQEGPDLPSAAWHVYERTVTVGPPRPVADFSGTPREGFAPLTVQFTDLSSNTPTSWNWDFGDGGASTEQNPSHTYGAAGTYTVKLTATNDAGSDTKEKPDYVVVSQLPHEFYVITATAGEGGAISPSGQVQVAKGADQTFTITPVAGYQILDVLVDEVSQGALTTYTFRDVQANHTIRASFGPIAAYYTITATKEGNGSINPSGEVRVARGEDQTFNMTPNPGYHVADVLVDGSSVGPLTTYTFPNVQADHTIHAVFAADVPDKFTIHATAGEGGRIAPSGVIQVDKGASQKFDIFADLNYEQDDVIVDGTSLGPVPDYTFPNIQADHAIQAVFAAIQYINIEHATEPIETENGIQMPSNGTIPVNTTLKSEKITVTFEAGTTVMADGTPYTGRIDPPRAYPKTDDIENAIKEQGLNPSTAFVFTAGRQGVSLSVEPPAFITLDVSGIGANAKVYVYGSDGKLTLAGVSGVHEGQTIEPGGTILTGQPNTLGLFLQTFSTFVAGATTAPTPSGGDGGGCFVNTASTGSSGLLGTTALFGAAILACLIGGVALCRRTGKARMILKCLSLGILIAGMGALPLGLKNVHAEPVSGALGAAAAAAGAGGAASIDAATAAGVAAASAAAALASALASGGDGYEIFAVSTHHSTASYHQVITPTHMTPSHHSTPAHH